MVSARTLTKPWANFGASMMRERPKIDIVNTYRPARARLKLGRYERYLAECLAVRVARLLEERDEAVPAGDVQGDVPEAGGRAVSPSSLLSRARAPANNPPV